MSYGHGKLLVTAAVASHIRDAQSLAVMYVFPYAADVAALALVDDVVCVASHGGRLSFHDLAMLATATWGDAAGFKAAAVGERVELGDVVVSLAVSETAARTLDVLTATGVVTTVSIPAVASA